MPYVRDLVARRGRPVACRSAWSVADRDSGRLIRKSVLEVDRARGAREALDLDLDAGDLRGGRDRAKPKPVASSHALWLLPATEMLARVLSAGIDVGGARAASRCCSPSRRASPQRRRPSMKRSSPTPTVVAAPVVDCHVAAVHEAHVAAGGDGARDGDGVDREAGVRVVVDEAAPLGTVAPAAMPSTVACLVIVFVMGAPPVGFAIEPIERDRPAVGARSCTCPRRSPSPSPSGSTRPRRRAESGGSTRLRVVARLGEDGERVRDAGLGHGLARPAQSG